ncbi:MAG: hypothetical protein ABWX87_09765 [Pseudoxanthomonas sp.]|jgi:hypothetical protein
MPQGAGKSKNKERSMKRSGRATLMAVALAALTMMKAPTALAIDSTSAVRAANLWSRIEYPGDAHEGYNRPEFVNAADLDGDGRDEVIYLQRITCDGGGSHDCTNEVSVLRTPIRPDSWVLTSPDPFITMFGDSRQSIVESGYDHDAYLQIPGDIEKLAIVGHTIRVTFIATLKSHACNRPFRVAGGPMSREPACPQPGRYVWILQWKPGELKRLEEDKSS